MGLNFVATIKERLLEKLSVGAVPADALENARQFLEGVVTDVTQAAQGLTRDALHRIKTHLVDLLPFLSPAITTKMVDDAEKEAIRENQHHDVTEEGRDHDQHQQRQSNAKSQFALPTSSFFSSLVSKPLSRL